MLKLDTSEARKFVPDSVLKQAEEKARKSLEKLKTGTGVGSEWLGWRDLLAEPDDMLLEEIGTLAERIREQADLLVVCGIGGSYLGSRAVLDMFDPGPAEQQTPQVLFAGHHMGAAYHKRLLQYLDRPKADGSPRSVYLNVISKSGSTLETALAFRLLRNWMHSTYGEDASARIICTTGPEGGVLNELVDQYGYRKFVIPDSVGGRFSVLTPVGLFPIAVGGIDIRNLFEGAADKYRELEQKAGPVVDFASLRYALFLQGKVIDVITSFEPELIGFCKWVQQLMGESEGKEGKGIFPTVASYSTDLHSIGQMVQQGMRNILETVIEVRDPVGRLDIPELERDVDELNYLAGKSMHEINLAALQGTRQAHLEGGVPVISVILDSLNARQVGELIYFYELFAAVYVYCLDLNPFDQPGVEAYKKAMYQRLEN